MTKKALACMPVSKQETSTTSSSTRWTGWPTTAYGHRPHPRSPEVGPSLRGLSDRHAGALDAVGAGGGCPTLPGSRLAATKNRRRPGTYFRQAPVVA
jgi:hypothetical protein